MNILNFVKALLPRLKKNQLAEDLRVTLEELRSEVEPIYQSMTELFKTKKPASKEFINLNKVFNHGFKPPRGGRQPNMVADINNVLKSLTDIAKYLRESVDQVIENDIIADGLTAKKALLIRSAEHVSYLSRFSLDLANYLVSMEQIGKRPDLEETISLSKADKQKVEKQISRFASLLSDYSMGVEEFKKIVELTPDVNVGTKSGGVVAGLYKEKEVDPLNNPLVANFRYNPWLYISFAYNEWQDRRYRAARAKKETLELRILQLKLEYEKKSNPKLEDEIRYTQSRLDRLTQELRDAEEAAGVEA